MNFLPAVLKNALISNSLLVAIVITEMMIWGSKCHKKNPGGM